MISNIEVHRFTFIMSIKQQYFNIKIPILFYNKYITIYIFILKCTALIYNKYITIYILILKCTLLIV